ncbi:unnamed protein product [Fraxinus pennsylvanica]|uniref:Uncharacterized protein n=1 Tax=Fraxinus pennsylvanica TaxID=56036 RepID=A0AAD2DQN9_9LAMI|nr:unnamed protein product [Fraxinus pennsylvanica]
MYKSNYSEGVDDDVDSNSDSGCNRMSWKWTQSGSVAECGFQKLKKPDVSMLLNGSWVVVAGDSQASDYSVTVDEIGMKLDFMWALYVRNLTNLMLEFKGNKDYPDVILMGAGLWDMLLVNNATEYGISLSALKDLVLALLPVFRNTDSIDRKANLRVFGLNGNVAHRFSVARKEQDQAVDKSVGSLTHSIEVEDTKRVHRSPSHYEGREAEEAELGTWLLKTPNSPCQ